MSDPDATLPASMPDPAELLGRALESRPATGHPQDWEPPGPEALQVQLQGYVVSHFLARGGMGAVYRGVHMSLDRHVAIKILPPQLRHGDPQYATRFQQEARAMAQLNHPGIVSVYDFGQMADGTLYFIMEFIDGTDVGQMVLKQGRLSSAHAMSITAHVCDALQYAHERGIVHRDIKPANIMVGYDGRVKVADFGLAKSVRQVDTSLTQSGYVMGTPHFVAPEALIIGMQVDHRADIYAVGVMLYQMLTGKVPQGMFEMPSMQVPGLDPRYDQIIASAMREDREQRFPSVLHLRRSLDAILTRPVLKSEALPSDATVPAPAARSPQPSAKPAISSRQSRSPQAARTAPAVKKKTSGLGWLVAALAALILGGLAWIQTSGPAASTAEAAGMLKTIGTVETASKEQPYINSLGMSFVPVPGTRVLMCQHETRRQDYETYAGETPGVDESWRNQMFENKPCGHEGSHPVLGVSWNDARAFCEWLGKKEGLKVRLPTDREWSQAAGIAKDEPWDAPGTPKTRDCVLKTYTWGPSHPPKSAEVEGNYGDSTYGAQYPGEPFIECYDGFPSTAPVKSFNANGFGLHDLGGNAREWVEDLWDTGSTDHVLRGSAWHSTYWNGMVTSRRQAAPSDLRSYETGFRCVIEMPESFPDQPMPKVTSPFSPIDDPAFEKQIGRYSWKMRNKDWVAYFGPNHEALVREGDEYRMWHWWVVGPRTIHVQFASQPAQFDASIGEDRMVDPAMTTMTRLSNNEVITDRDRSVSPALIGSEDGFVTLLGASGTDGWTYSGPPGAAVSQADGITSFATGPGQEKSGMFWYSKRPFADFVLRLDFKISDFKKNSGVHLRLPALKEGPQPTPYPQGLEVEIFHRQTGRTPFFSGDTLRPPRLIIGDWNTYEITAKGPDISVMLNGVPVNQHVSKRGSSGYIGIQDYDDGMPMEFRNVRIKELSASSVSPPASARPAPSAAAAPAALQKAACTQAGRMEALLRTGGSPEVERAVSTALEYLKSKQNPDGSWGTELHSMNTALALLAFMGRCETADSPVYGETVLKGLLYLISISHKNTQGMISANLGSMDCVLEHGMALTALAEACTAARAGSKMLPGLVETLQKGTDLILASQMANGGWGGEPNKGFITQGDGGHRVTVWQCIALDAVARTGLRRDNLHPMSVRALDYLISKTVPGGGYGQEGVSPRMKPVFITGPILHAISLLRPKDTGLTAGGVQFYMDQFQQTPPGWENADLHTWFHLTAVMRKNKDHWARWRQAFVPILLAYQSSFGSWHHSTVFPGGGEIDSTAMAVLMLESFYRGTFSEDDMRGN